MKPVFPSSGDALKEAQGVGDAGYVEVGVLWLGFVFFGRIGVFVLLVLRGGPWVGFPHAHSDGL
ncbi:MAG: hypothetical protein ABSA93_23010, partial [Streptosporangiaceae bacterium]